MLIMSINLRSQILKLANRLAVIVHLRMIHIGSYPMSKIIKVRFVIIAIAHDSFASATQESKGQELALINGEILAGYEFSGHDLILRLNNSACCCISIGANCIRWFVRESYRKSDKPNPPTDITFEYPSGEHQAWDWKNKLEELIGKKISLSPNEQFLFLYSEDKKEYIFNCVESINDSTMKYLYISDV